MPRGPRVQRPDAPPLSGGGMGRPGGGRLRRVKGPEGQPVGSGGRRRPRCRVKAVRRVAPPWG